MSAPHIMASLQLMLTGSAAVAGGRGTGPRIGPQSPARRTARLQVADRNAGAIRNSTNATEPRYSSELYLNPELIALLFSSFCSSASCIGLR
jgi:hypothetical protein